MRLAIVLLLTCGCRQIFGIDQPRLVDSGIPPSDTSIDASDGAPPPLCFSRPELGLSACFAHHPTMPFDVPAVVAFDTDVDAPAVCEPLISQSQDMCVVAATEVTVSASVSVTGSRPLVIFATGTIAIDALFDVASHAATTTRGPGENPAVCATSGAGVIGGGGAGGSFTTAGGDGGDGGQAGSSGGTARAAFAAQTFHGGCRGGLGGGSLLGEAYGGGALALVANIVTIDAAIDASGAGGAGAAPGARGGFGGGAGGMVVIDAPTVNFGTLGQVFANGGGGGGGSSLSTAGGSGGEASSFNSIIQGGSGGNTGGGGGRGYPQTEGGRPSNGQNAGGGGGGGGAGAILIYSLSSITGQSKTSPQATFQPY